VHDYTVLHSLNHEAFIGKRLKYFNEEFRHKTKKIRYDTAMTTRKPLGISIIAALIFFSMHIAVFAEKPKDGKHALSYRGMRMPNDGGLFYVTKIETETEHAGIIEIEIKFNIPADPRTLQKTRISINGRFLPADALIAFNKAGDKMKIVIQSSFLSDEKDTANRLFHIDLPEAKSFNHIPLYHSHFDDIKHDKEYTFKFLRTPSQPPNEMREEMHGEMHKHTEPRYDYVRFEED